MKVFSVRDQNAKGMSNSSIKQLMKGSFWAVDCQDKPLKIELQLQCDNVGVSLRLRG